MRNFITIAEGHTVLTEATFDKEIDKIVAKVLRGSAGHSKGKMIDRDAVLNKGFDMALALDDGKEGDNIFTGIKNFVVTDDFLERQYFGKIAKRLGLKGMFMNNGRYITTDVDEYDRYELGRGDNDDAVEQNNKGLLPGSVAKKFKIDLKFKGAANDPAVAGKAGTKDSKPDKEWQIQSNGKRGNFNIDRSSPYVDEIKDGKKIRTYGSVDQLRKMFGDDADIQNKPTYSAGPMKSDSEAGKGAEIGEIVITDDNAMKYIRRYKELIKKQNESIYSGNFQSVFGDLYKQLDEAKLSADEEKELQAIISAFEVALKQDSVYTNSIKREMKSIVKKENPGVKYAWDTDDDSVDAVGSEEDPDKKSPDEINKDVYGDPAIYDPDYDKKDKTAKDIDKDVMGDPAIYDPDFKDEIKKGSTSSGALAKFAKSGKGGLANDADEVDAIKELQQRLKEMGIEMTIDGKYGKGTVDAVKRVQEMLGAKQDGDAGPNTIGAIIKMGNIPGVITFYDDLKRMVELSKKVKTESNDFRYMMTMLEGGNLLEALSAAEQKEYDDLMAKHKAKFDDPEYQMSLPKSIKDLMGQIIRQDPKGVASDSGAGQGADQSNVAGMGSKIIDERFLEMPLELQTSLGLGRKNKDKDGNFIGMYIDLQLSPNGRTIYIRRRRGKTSKFKTRMVYNVTSSEGKEITDYLDSNNIKYGPAPEGVDPNKTPDATKDDGKGAKTGGEDPPYDTQYSGTNPMNDMKEFFKGLESGLDPYDEADDFLEAIDTYMDKEDISVNELNALDRLIKETISVLNGNQRTPSGKIITNVVSDSRSLQQAVASIKSWRTEDFEPAMRTALKGGGEKDTSVASDAEAGGEADQTTTSDAEEVKKLGDAVKNNTASPAVIAKSMHTALYGDGMLSSIWRYVNDDEEGFMTAFKQIKDGAQLKAVEAEFQKLSGGLDIRGAVAQEMREKSAEVKQIYAELKDKKADAGGGGSATTTSATTTSAQDNNPNADFQQDINIKDGNWARIATELGYANQNDFVQYHIANGTAEMKDILKNPNKYSSKPVKLLKNPNHDGSTVGSAKASSSDAGAGADKASVGATATTTVASVEPRPLSSGGRNQTQKKWDQKYGKTHNHDGSPKNENKEYDMTKKVNEAASMNISMNGDNSAEVAELVALLRNAGMEKAEPVSDMPMYKDKHDDMVSKIQMMDPEQGPMDSPSPCGMGEEDVGEEWDNSPDEEYRDDDYMTRDIAGGLNRPKPPGALRAKDPAIHNEDVDKYKSELRKGLEDLYKTI